MSARNDIIAYSREHLDLIPVEEHPAHPILDPLPRTGTNIKPGGLRQTPSRTRMPD